MFTPDYKMSPATQRYHDLKVEEEEAGIRLGKASREAGDRWRASEEHPEKGPIYEEFNAAARLHSKTMEEYREKIKAAKEACHEAEIDQWWAAWKDWVYSDENARPACGTAESESPCGRYKLVVSAHATGPSTWGYTKGKVYDLEDPEKPPVELRRNYSTFWHTWQIRDGKTYLWWGEDYQSYSLLDCEEGTYRTQYIGFCWVEVEPSPDGATLLAYGCYWAAPYQYKVYDWPDVHSWPLLEVGDIQAPYPADDGSQGVEWLEGGNLRVFAERLYRISDDVDVESAWDRDDIPTEEYERLEGTVGKEGAEAEYRKDWTVWERPSPLKLYQDLIDWNTRMQSYWEKYPDRGGEDGRDAFEARLWRQMELVWEKIPEDQKPERVHP